MLKIKYTILLGVISITSMSTREIVAMQTQGAQEQSFFARFLSVLQDHWDFMSETAKEDNKKNMETLNSIEHFLLGVSEPHKENKRGSRSLGTEKEQASSYQQK